MKLTNDAVVIRIERFVNISCLFLDLFVFATVYAPEKTDGISFGNFSIWTRGLTTKIFRFFFLDESKIQLTFNFSYQILTLS